nr:hypothetical protein B0A51_05840 [Rachicladosporium sp. CCFEE 5018]
MLRRTITDTVATAQPTEVKDVPTVVPPTEPKVDTATEATARTCVVCCDTVKTTPGDPIMVKPCRSCPADYCSECLIEMFTAAAYVKDRLPPQCCTLLQLHTVLPHLAPEIVTAYRMKLTEWIARIKTYCPSKPCSVFIPETVVPSHVGASKPKSLQQILRQVLDKMREAPASRFFRDASLQSSLPGYNDVIHMPTDLDTIQRLVDASTYTKAGQFLETVKLIETNAVKYNKSSDHPVAQAAKDVVAIAQREVANSIDQLVDTVHDVAQSTQQLFACPTCHIAICTRCRQIAHTGYCDNSAEDHEAAMLLSFGYKRCPRCKHGLKKMYGCSHMACICGAHFCWYCMKSIRDCNGDCAEMQAEYSSEEGGNEGEDDSDESEDELASPNIPLAGAVTAINASANAADTPTQGATTAIENAQAPQGSPDGIGNLSQLTRNLDAGGARRWAGAEEDFGEEPDDSLHTQVWSCIHNFALFDPKPDGYYHGDTKLMECNRCTAHVEPYALTKAGHVAKPLRRKHRPVGLIGKGFSYACKKCFLIACPRCKDVYEAEGDGSKAWP